MVRMSDILKKVEQRNLENEQQKPAEETPAQPAPQAPPAPEQAAPQAPAQPASAQPTPPAPPAPEQAAPQAPAQPASAQPAPPAPTAPEQPATLPPSPADTASPASKHGIRLSRPGLERAAGLNNEQAIHLYLKTLDCVKDLFQKVKNDVAIVEEDQDIINFVEQFVDQQLLDNDNIIGMISLPADKNYLYNHAINVCLISVEIGIALGYKREELVDLGVAAILYDIGMIKYDEIYSQPRVLTPEEREQIKGHTAASFEILKKFKHISPRVATVAYQEHERQDGSGYPCGLKGDSIDEYVKILAVADVYDAITHPRPHRKEMQPYDALNLVIQSKDVLDAKGVRAFIERICCPYPIGCYVKLSSGEKGMVVGRNIGTAFRPIVEIIYNLNRESAEMTRIIDLNKHPAIYIKDYMTKGEMEEMLG